MLGDKDDIKDVDTKDEFDDTMELEAEAIAAKSGNVGDPSVELNVDEILAELEADMGIEASDHGQDARKRLESLLEERRAARELDELDEFALDDA
jgi:hypothetical protein